jgi:hypothetical protein
VNSNIWPVNKCCRKIGAVFHLWDSPYLFTGYEGIFPWK